MTTLQKIFDVLFSTKFQNAILYLHTWTDNAIMLVNITVRRMMCIPRPPSRPLSGNPRTIPVESTPPPHRLNHLQSPRLTHQRSGKWWVRLDQSKLCTECLSHWTRGWNCLGWVSKSVVSLSCHTCVPRSRPANSKRTPRSLENLMWCFK